ncbi:MAG: hypothetical protein BA873_11520 [Desulfobulbaceae bacterium C00003063]|nr:MAG: hypothetical protein BA873_11520 [Desulfobulbaceae bacterium C00003063]
MYSYSQTSTLPPFEDKIPAILDMSRFREEKQKFFNVDPTARYLTEQLESDIPCVDQLPVRGSFEWTANRMGLDDVSCFVLALGLSVSFDNAMGSVVASCLNDPMKNHPNLALAQKLWDDPDQVLMLADPAHPLFSCGLLHHASQAHNYSRIDWDAPIVVPSLAAHQLLFPSSSHPDVLVPITFEDAPVLADNSRLVASRLHSNMEDTLHVVPVRGPAGCERMEVVHGIAQITQRDVLEFRGNPELLKNRDYMNSLATFCWLRNADLFFDQDIVSALTGSRHDSTVPHSDPPFFPLQSIPITIFLGIVDRSQLASIPLNILLPIVDVPEFSYHQRMDHWKKVLGSETAGLDSIISECSRRFRYEKKTINKISTGLKGISPISEKDLIRACRAELELDPGELAQKVVPRFEDEELILPPRQHVQFREIIRAMKSLTRVHYGWGTDRVWNESGISVLFAGPPGSGKTMGAEILAIKLDLPMFRIDLSQVVNKYIGETEKNLKRLFDAADISDIILFFDEADALFGRRTDVKDAHDRYANLEISYLLERMERFKGLAILATNRKKDLDEAFLRRLRYIIDFPLPEKEQRKRIWHQVIPNTVDSSGLDLEFLARQFQLTGGHIRSIVFNACLQSADSGQDGGQLTMEHVIIAVKREYDKLNRSISLEQFGDYAGIIEKLEKGVVQV